MKKTFQIYMKDNSKITIDAVVKSTNETSIKVYKLFEQDTPCLLLNIEHEEINTLLDLTKTSPYTLLYYHERYLFEAAAYSNNETESPFFINTQFKKVLFIPLSVKFSPSAIEKHRIMETVEKKPLEQSFQHKTFLNGSIVPINHYQKNMNVKTIMLEVNRNLYLNEPSNNKSENFIKIKEIVSDFIQILKSEFHV